MLSFVLQKGNTVSLLGTFPSDQFAAAVVWNNNN